MENHGFQTTLGEIVEMKKGISYRSTELVNSEHDGIPLINLKSFKKSGGFNENGLKYFCGDYGNSNLLQPDDLIIANTDLTPNGDILGSPILLPKELHSKKVAFSVDTTRYRIIDERVSPSYLYHLLQTPLVRLQFKRYLRGATVKRFAEKDAKKIELSFPTVEEQERIVTILDKADEIKQTTKFVRSMEHQLISSTFLDLFGDPHVNPHKFQEMTLRDVSTHYTDGPFGSNLKSSHYTTEGPRVIRLGDIDVGGINTDNISHISLEHYESLQRHHLCEGDVVIATLGNPMLRSAVVKRSALPAINKSDVVLIRPNSNLVLSEYISCLFNSTLKGGYWSNLVHGQTRGRISGGQLSKVVIPVPPLNMQQIFVTRVKSIAQFVKSLELAQTTSSSFVESITQEMLS